VPEPYTAGFVLFYDEDGDITPVNDIIYARGGRLECERKNRSRSVEAVGRVHGRPESGVHRIRDCGRAGRVDGRDGGNFAVSEARIGEVANGGLKTTAEGSWRRNLA
jgi:hypothetical protein